MSKKRILLVEDDVDIQMMVVEVIEDKAQVVCVATEEDAYHAVQDGIDFDIILLDGVLGNSNTLQFSVDVRKRGYAGPMVAMSSGPDFRLLQMQNGCDHECEKKNYAAALALKLLGLS